MYLKKLITLFSFALLVNVASAALGGLVGRVQSAAVNGTLVCNGVPASDVLVKMYDDDRGFDMDDFMGETTTDSRGYFHLAGSISEISDIDPKFNVYHDCDDWIWPCQRKFSIMLPDGYITVGNIPRKIYNAGVIELAGKQPGETRDCIH